MHLNDAGKNLCQTVENCGSSELSVFINNLCTNKFGYV